MSTNRGIPGRGLRAASDLARDKPHGARIKYLGGCRCLPCRAANANYANHRAEMARAGLTNGIIDAKRAREHMKLLRRYGVGYKAVADTAGVARSVCGAIISRKKRRIRQETERAILGVSRRAALPGAHIPAGPTWRRIAWLLAHGWTKARIATAILGNERAALQLGRSRVTKETADKVERAYRHERTPDAT